MPKDANPKKRWFEQREVPFKSPGDKNSANSPDPITGAAAVFQALWKARGVLNYKPPDPGSLNPSGMLRWGGKDVFLHTLVLGPTGCGKTSTLLIPIANQILDEYERGNRVGMTIIEPKGDFARAIYFAAKARGIPAKLIDPALPDESWGSNPFVGENDNEIAEMIRTVLRKLFGKQEPFFAAVQESTAKNFTLLIKRLYGNDANFVHLLRTLRSKEMLANAIEAYEKAFSKDDLSEDLRVECLEDDSFFKFTKGLRVQISDILSNDYVREIFTRKNTLSLKQHLEEGGIICVSTDIGRLKKMGDVFGTFFLMAFQNDVFRRPSDESARDHYLIVDEFARYINPDFQAFLELGRGYRVASYLAMQSLGQFAIEGYPGIESNILTNCRNKFVFGGLSFEDREKFSKEFGEEKRLVESRSYQTILGMKHFKAETVTQREEYVRRFTETQLKELPSFHFVYQLVVNNQPMPPGLAKGRWVELAQVAKDDPLKVVPQPDDASAIVAPDLAEVNTPVHVVAEVAATLDTSTNTLSVPTATTQPDEIQLDESKWFVLRKQKKEKQRNGTTNAT